MKQSEINREVADALGETVAEIRRHGFDIERDLRQLDAADCRCPFVLDWDSGEVRAWPMA
jgi:hypothetical protein